MSEMDEIDWKKGVCHKCKKPINIPPELYSEENPEETFCFECMEEAF